MAQPDHAYGSSVVRREQWFAAQRLDRPAGRDGAAWGPSSDMNGYSASTYVGNYPLPLQGNVGNGFAPQGLPSWPRTNSAQNNMQPGFSTVNGGPYERANGSSKSAAAPAPWTAEQARNGVQTGRPLQSPMTSDWNQYGSRLSPDSLSGSPGGSDQSADHGVESVPRPVRDAGWRGRGTQRRPENRDEFDGPHQFLPRPPPEIIALQEQELPHQPTHLFVHEQDQILAGVNERLSRCAFDFMAKYQFPIPMVDNQREVEGPQDREWTEWAKLLQRLATRRRIPTRVLYNGQIKQLATILGNSLEMPHAAKHQSRPLKDDRNILQLVSAGIQVAKILKDAQAMEYLDKLYVSTERTIRERAASGAARFRS